MDFIDLEIRLGIHTCNITNNSNQKIDNKSLKQLIIQKEYCATTRTVLRGAWFFEFIDFIYE